MRLSPLGGWPSNIHSTVSGAVGTTSTIVSLMYSCTATDSASNEGPRLLIDPGTTMVVPVRAA